ncbi:MAG: glycogen/starch/alpha-glucan phosphorylase [Oscillospiraceae bacterium]|nr:glycogen/starch/alpha-glucan phosphorylase [Oscillospiraceae bacterium]
MDIKKDLQEILTKRCKRELKDCTTEEVYYGLLELTQKLCAQRPAAKGERKLYYFSAEFLMGKLLSNNLLALGIFDQVSAILSEAGHDLSLVEEVEPEPSLGNGGLGRLAACFLDSIAALGLQGDGVGLNYHYGLFRQKFESNKQKELPNPWIEKESWLIPTGVTFKVPFGFGTVDAVLWDIAIPGAHSGVANKLHLFDTKLTAPAPEVGIDFDKTDVESHLTAFLYPDDSDDNGRLLRVYQQYFMVSAGAQLILKELEERGYKPEELCQHVAIQINDTHPSLIIPELTRLLLERGLTMDQALHQVAHACAYTNHTILAEALEKWPMSFLRKVAPQLESIIRELDRRAKLVFPNPQLAIIDENDTVHMARMDIHYGYSVNGVAALHTEILMRNELKPFADVYKEKFNNKTNGITLRRWLEACNPRLANLLDECVGPEWRKDASRLDRFTSFCGDGQVLAQMYEIKRANKIDLSNTFSRMGISVDPYSVYDIQVKRLHEYKRQQMNALYVIQKYLDIKEGKFPSQPITVIFGAKAAPAYTMAKHIIHLILCLRQLIENDPIVRPWLRVVMVENYNVSWAEKLIPACDISEQISLASKEASGTGNMKFMANGAVTLGTMDGANVEIAQLVGHENIYTFGASSNQVIEMYAKYSYHAEDYYNRPAIRRLVDFILSPTMFAIGDENSLRALWYDLTTKDWFKALLDVEEYIRVRDQAIFDYGNRSGWVKKMMINTARSGFFSSDRTISQYNRDIWHL